jgi:hypothetical protein
LPGSPLLSQNLLRPKASQFATTKTITIQTNETDTSIVVAQFEKNQLKRTMSPRKSVSFNKNVHLRLTQHVNDYSVEEEEACWYSCEDYIKMNNDVRCTVNMIEEAEINSTNVFDDVQYCRRGCEKWTHNGAKRTRTRRRKAITAVLSEQYTQVAHYGSLNEHRLLAIAYRQYSYRSQQSAYSMGIDDEKIVQPYQEEQEQNHRFSKRQSTTRAKRRTQIVLQMYIRRNVSSC